MRLDISQQLKTEQRMMLAPRMIQSMEILQLPMLALQERIQQELLSNPTLELEEPADFVSSLDQEAPDSYDDIHDSERDLIVKDDNEKTDSYERLAGQAEDFSEYLDRSEYVGKQKNSDDIDRKLDAMGNTAAPGKNLIDHLNDQWVFIECDDLTHKIGAKIIELIDNNGYLSVELPKIREYLDVTVTDQQLNDALKLVQTMEPVGVGARDFIECLTIQLKADNKEHKLELQILHHYLKEIELNHYPQVAKALKCSVESVKSAIKNISRLDPRPGLQFSNVQSNFITPEIIVEYDEDNDTYSARLSDGSNPILKINSDYADLLKSRHIAASDRDYLRKNVRSAEWLIDAVQQRKATLLKVVNIVLKTQREFFSSGPQALKPLPMIDVAAELGIHVGTVSRAVSEKYMQTPSGIFPLRYFFTSGKERADGETISWDAIRAKMQELIDNEDKKKPLKDEIIADMLLKLDFKISRRTVAKYRDIMNIPPARKRKQF
ncbi:MAG: RNA polymerase factor sigma-54 [Sedimentisphaerales bacterium]|nr:RNA polymerase factor sigma-54 [Sedimentisphaerales bacterium]MBN2842963.1 RNA polymerase factor sigma-54 [Sedimentisphaerales bacterium]